MDGKTDGKQFDSIATSHIQDNGAINYGRTEDGESVVSSPTSDQPTVDSKDADLPERGTWSAKMDFMLSAVGYAVGFGNVWRFPYLCYLNGGGAFLIPYFFMMIFAGMPLFYLELAIGQYAALGPITVWGICPLFKGLGYAMVGISALVSVYYNVILSLSIFYLFSSFTSELPWSKCGHWWNQHCSNNPYAEGIHCNESNILSNVTIPSPENLTCTNLTNAGAIAKSAAEEYWQYYALGMTNETNIENVGSVRWHLTLCHLLAWIIVFLCIVKGVKSSGKVVYFTATFPYVVLFILFIRGVTLPGAGEGLKYYLTPQFDKMRDISVWNDAAIQILFSLGPGFGSLIMLSSYNKFNNKCNRDAVTVTLINCFTSFFAGFVIFSVLGFMSHTRQVSVDKVVDKGPGLAFVVYPEALAMMPGAPFWSICFFFMLFTLGLDSQFAGVECIITGLMDEFAVVARWKKSFVAVVCVVLFLSGIPCLTQGGMFVIELIDKFTTSFPLLFVTLFEVVVINWIYGFRRFASDIKSMVGYKPNYYWLACWVIITPLVLVLILIFKCLKYTGIEYEGYKYPLWAEGVGWVLSASLLAFIPAWMVISLCRCIGSWSNLWWVIRGPASIKILNLRSLVEPDRKWKPAIETSKRAAGKEADENLESDGGYAVAYHEGECFVIESPIYSNPVGESHI